MVPSGTLQAGILQHDFVRVVRDSAMSGDERACLRPAQRHMNLRNQRERVALAGILHADGPAGGLGCAEVNSRTGESVSALLIEDEVCGLEVDGILEFSGSSLIGSGSTRRV